MAQQIAPPPPTTEDKWTYERYLRETAEGEYFTIIAGEKIVSPSPNDLHQIVLGNLYSLLRAWMQQTRLGALRLAPLDVVLSEDTVTQPDLFVVLATHKNRITSRNVRGAPDLVIEILSPGSVRLDREKKRALYARHNVPEYWIVSPGERTVEVLRLQGQQYETAALLEEGDSLESPLLPGFTCAVKDIFVE
jgi:Uma2 family endonuclease